MTATLTPAYPKHVHRLADTLRETTGVHVTISGPTDAPILDVRLDDIPDGDTIGQFLTTWEADPADPDEITYVGSGVVHCHWWVLAMDSQHAGVRLTLTNPEPLGEWSHRLTDIKDLSWAEADYHLSLDPTL